MKLKGLEKAIEKFNLSEQTARIYLDIASMRVECRKYITQEEGRFDFRKNTNVLLISKEIPYGEKNSISTTVEEVVTRAREEIEEYKIYLNEE